MSEDVNPPAFGSVGFLGLGELGYVMVQRLASVCKQMTIYNRTRQKAEALAGANVVVADSPAEVATSSDVIVSCLHRDGDRALFLGPNAVTSVPLKGVSVINTSTIGPAFAIELAAAVEAQGGAYLDCALMLGDRNSVRDGSVTIPAAGDPLVFERARPILEFLGGVVERTGPIGSAQVLKLVNNAQTGVAAVSLAQALALAAAGNVEPDALRRLLPLGSSRSWTSEHFLEAMLDRRGDPGRTVGGEDVKLACDLAASYGLDITVARAAADGYRRATAEGHGDVGRVGLAELDWSASVSHASRRLNR